MSCQSVRKVLSAYVDLRLSEQDHAGVTRHLACCVG
jgi:predicted anti-sigma-YlaC factor YlaD